ncbi:hypothetical protein [Streptomyces celluloflavus]|uniref:hypothetical protein n=1 Tax=Streptomyces celluloflavus TaxID=58344 RepID=UPI00364F4DA0
MRNVLGSVIALIGAAAAVWSPFRPWYDGRHGRDVPIQDLFNGLTGNSAPLLGSLFLPMAFAALLTLLGVALRSRLLVGFAALVVLGFTILWMVRQGQAAGELTAGTGGLGVGAANALGGGAVMLLGALIMRGGGRRSRERPDGRPTDERHGGGRYDDGRYGEGPYGDGRYDDGQLRSEQYGGGQYGGGQYGSGQYGSGQYDGGQYGGGQYGPGQAGHPGGHDERGPYPPPPVPGAGGPVGGSHVAPEPSAPWRPPAPTPPVQWGLGHGQQAPRPDSPEPQDDRDRNRE